MTKTRVINAIMISVGLLLPIACKSTNVKTLAATEKSTKEPTYKDIVSPLASSPGSHTAKASLTINDVALVVSNLLPLFGDENSEKTSEKLHQYFLKIHPNSGNYWNFVPSFTPGKDANSGYVFNFVTYLKSRGDLEDFAKALLNSNP